MNKGARVFGLTFKLTLFFVAGTRLLAMLADLFGMLYNASALLLLPHSKGLFSFRAPGKLCFRSPEKKEALRTNVRKAST